MTDTTTAQDYRDNAGNVVTLDRPRAESPRAESRPEPKPEAKPDAEPAAKEPAARQAPAPAAKTDAAPGVPTKKHSRARAIMPILLLAALGGGAYYGYNWWTQGRFFVSTDDAYVQADVTTLGTKVNGYVATVAVKDGDHVKAGDVLATLDDTDYRLALDSARARRATQTATIERIAQQVTAQQAMIDSAEAGIVSAQAAVKRAASAFDRATTLAQQNYSTKATLDQATADRDQTAAALTTAQAALSAAKANLGVIQAQRMEAEQAARELDVAIAKAQSDLDSTVLRAPAAGVIGNRAVQVGQYVSPGSRLAALVPMQSAYIAANFKETQLADIRPGQTVDVEVDALSGQVFKGRVESLAAATGSTFSLLPPENATGNFTKITQRLPVRIEMPADVLARGVLRPGLSVVASVDTRTGPKD